MAPCHVPRQARAVSRRMGWPTTCAHNSGPRGRQQGQGLVLGLFAASAAGIMLVMVYNVGQVALARSRLTQATDAAAYSGALVQARTLNMLAHVQRTQVGHQVALAHLVTLGAWAQIADAQHVNHQRGNPPGMIIGRFFGPGHRRAYGQSKALAPDTQAALVRAIKGHTRATHVTLGNTARALVQGLPVARAMAIEQVLAANLPPSVAAGPDVQWDIVRDEWASLLVRRAPLANSALADLVRRSVEPYGFLAKRHRTAYNPWSIHPACPWMLHTLARRGATWMDDTGRWQAVDTQSFQARRFNRHIGCYYREYAMGWGAVRGSPARTKTSSEDDLPDLSKEAFWRWARRATRWDLRLAENRVAGLRAMMRAWAPPQRGLTPWYDILEQGRLSSTFELEVRQNASTIPTSDRPTTGFRPLGWFRFLGLGDRPMRVRAAAQAYFSPERGQSAASVFRPQWRARLSPTWRESGQALIEMTLALILLLTLAGAALLMGERIQQHLGDDQTSRWLAFTALPDDAYAGSVSRAGSKIPASALTAIATTPSISTSASTASATSASSTSETLGWTSVSKATPARALPSASVSVSTPLMPRAQPGGVNRDAIEMRRAWAYADQGLVSAQVGTRTTVVARDAGHHHDHRATQTRLAESQSAWRRANDASRKIARTIEAQAGRADDGWQRPSLSLDWLTPWSPQDIRQRQRRRQQTRRTAACPRKRRQTWKPRLCHPHALAPGLPASSPWVFYTRALIISLPLISLCPWAAAAVCPIPGVVPMSRDGEQGLEQDLPQVSGGGAGIPETSWQQAITVLTGLAQAVDTTVGSVATHAVDGFFWLGIPMASQRFSVDLPVTPGVGAAKASVAQVLSAIQPALEDFAIVDDRFLLAGLADNAHWLAQWEETATHAVGTLSVMRLARPVFDIAAPAWLKPNAQVVTHLIHPDSSLLVLSGRPARRRAQASPGRPAPGAGGWSSTSVWQVQGSAQSVTWRIGQALRAEGWVPSTQGASVSVPTIDLWVKGNCTMALQVLNDVSAVQASQVWLRSSGQWS